jgi:hypothetical protein
MFRSQVAEATPDFTATLREAVRRELARGAGLGTLLGSLDGADPALILGQLRSLAASEDPLGSHAQRLLIDSARTREMLPAEPPLPHPLDYAWHFTPATQVALVARLAELAAPGERVVHLGTPTLHRAALQKLGDREHLLLDRDARQVARANRDCPGSALAVDLLASELPHLEAVACVADPPWYPAQASAYVNAAARFLGPGRTLLLAWAGNRSATTRGRRRRGWAGANRGTRRGVPIPDATIRVCGARRGGAARRSAGVAFRSVAGLSAGSVDSSGAPYRGE